MKKLAVALLFCGMSTFAATLSYTTTGVFSSSGTNTDSNGDAVITFNGVSSTVGVPTFTSLGTFVVTATNGGTFSDNFTLNLTSSGTGSFSSAISGTITGNSSGIMVSLNPSSQVIGGDLWTLTPSSFGLNNPTVNSGITTVQAFVTTPEPASLGLLGASLAGLGIAFRRRKAA